MCYKENFVYLVRTILLWAVQRTGKPAFGMVDLMWLLVVWRERFCSDGNVLVMHPLVTDDTNDRQILDFRQ